VWPQQFALIRDILLSKIKNSCISIEHVGSTSIPGLAAKPILDIVIVIESPTLLSDIIVKLKKLGYTHDGDKGIPGRDAFSQDSVQVPYTILPQNWIKQHLYVCSKDALALRRFLLFRNFLRLHSDDAMEYEKLKRSLAHKFQFQREAYTVAKIDFITDILHKAKKQN